MCPGIKPCKTSTEDLHEQVSAFEISPVYVGDFQLATRRRFQGCRDVEYVVVVEIEPGYRNVRPRFGWLFLDADCPAVTIEFDYTVMLGGSNDITEHGCLTAPQGGAVHQVRK